MEFEEKIILDRRSFEALAVDTRVKILKSLKERRKTLSELSAELGMSVSGIKEHLETLENVSLIKKIDDGHKWKYYELTKKGKDLVGPRELRVMVLLSISLFALVASMFIMVSAPNPSMMAGMMKIEEPASADMLRGGESAPAAVPLAAEASADAAYPEKSWGPPSEEGEMMQDSEGASNQPEISYYQAPERDGFVPLLVASISLLTVIGCLGILIKNRIR